MNIGSKKLLGVALSAALGLGVASNAQADAYAVSINDVTNFAMTLGSGITVSVAPDTVSEASATHDGVGPATSLPLNAPQATAGAGPFPAEDTFTQHGRTGDYARGDALIRSTDIENGNGSAINIAESFDQSAHLGTGFGANTLTAEIIVVATPTDPLGGRVQFDFDANPYMESDVTTDQPGGLATAVLAFNISLEDQNAGVTVFDWNPDGISNNDGTGNDTEGAMSLNETLIAHSIDPVQDHNGARATFSYSNFLDLAPGTYNVAISMEERVSTQGVPEPASLLLMGGGLMGMAYIRRRKTANA